MSGLYDENGKVIFTEVDGSTFVGVYNPNGTYNAVNVTGSEAFVGIYHSSGAFNVTIDPTAQKVYNSNGSLNVYSLGNGTFRPVDGTDQSFTWNQWVEGLTAAQTLDIDFSYTDRHFQNIIGTTLADSAGEPIALSLDSSSWEGRTLAAEVANQAELQATGAIGLVGTATAATYNTLTGEGQVTRVAFPGDQSYVSFPTVAGAYYELDMVSAVNVAIVVRQTSVSGTSIFSTSNTRTKYRFAATGSAIYMTAGSNSTFTFTVYSLRRIPGNHASQATAGSQPSYEAGGVSRYDGTADNLLTSFLAQSGPMTLLYHGIVPETLAALQVVMGSSGSSANRCWLGFTTDGFVSAGVGSQTNTTIVGTTDVRGKEVVAGLTFDGTTVNLFLFVDGFGSVEYSDTQASTPTTTIPFRLGAFNSNGTAASFAAIDANSFKAAHKLITLSEFQQIAVSMTT